MSDTQFVFWPPCKFFLDGHVYKQCAPKGFEINASSPGSRKGISLIQPQSPRELALQIGTSTLRFELPSSLDWGNTELEDGKRERTARGCYTAVQCVEGLDLHWIGETLSWRMESGNGRQGAVILPCNVRMDGIVIGLGKHGDGGWKAGTDCKGLLYCLVTGGEVGCRLENELAARSGWRQCWAARGLADADMDEGSTHSKVT